MVEKENSTLICQGNIINYVTGKELISPSWMQVVCMVDNSLEETEINLVPYAYQANAKIDGIISKKYSPEEIDEIYNKHSLEDGKKIKHQLLPERYLDNKVHKFTDCVYYDINGAHTDALCTLFPKCKREFMKLHHSGQKAYINIYVGDLCNRGRRGVFNWIVDRTRTYLDKIIAISDGEILYANTDGVIIHHPANYLETSDEVGAFKSEIVDDTIYAYYCPSDDKSTAYTIYQYNNPKKGVVLKGNARLMVRQGMDLSKGIINKAKLVKDENNTWQAKDLRTEELDVYEEI